MKKLKMNIIAGLIAVIAILTTFEAVQAADLFADKNLQAAVKNVLKKGPKDVLKEADLKDVFILKARKSKIASLFSVSHYSKRFMT